MGMFDYIYSRHPLPECALPFETAFQTKKLDCCLEYSSHRGRRSTTSCRASQFWSQAPKCLLSDAQAVVPSPQIRGSRARSVPFVTTAIASRSRSGVR